MIIVNRQGDSIVGSINGTPFSVPFGDELYQALKEVETSAGEVETQEEYKILVEQATTLTELDFKSVIASKHPNLGWNPVKKQYFLQHTDGTFDDRPLPEGIVYRIEEAAELDMDIKPIVDCWSRFLLRDKKYTEEDASYFGNYLSAMFTDYNLKSKIMEEEKLDADAANERSTYHDLAITKGGLLATYKVVEEVTEMWKLVYDENGDVVYENGSPKKEKVTMDAYKPQHKIDPVTGDVETKENKPKYAEERLFTPAISKNGENFYNGEEDKDNYTYVYQVGRRQWLPKVNPVTGRPSNINHSNTFGGGGLYTGGLRYIAQYRTDKDPVLVCFLDPANIISFQSEGGAIRTWELFPNNILEEETELKGIYHSSKYLEESNERVTERINTQVKERKEAIDKENSDSQKLLDQVK